jgi:streptogramin lyase
MNVRSIRLASVAVAITLCTLITSCANRGAVMAPSLGRAVGQAAPLVQQSGNLPVQWTQFTPSTPSKIYQGIVAGPDKNMWFDDRNGDSIVKMTMTGAATVYPLGHKTYDLAAGADGKLYVGTSGGVAQVAMSGSSALFALPGSDVMTFDNLTLGPDGNVWFPSSAHVNRMTPAGMITPFAYPSGSSNNITAGITRGPDGNLWFTDYDAHAIGNVVPGTGVVTEFSLSGQGINCRPTDIVAGRDGNLWADCVEGLFVRVTPAGVATSYPNPWTTSNSSDQLAIGPDKNIWFVGFYGGIGELDPVDLSITGYLPNYVGDQTYTLALGPDGNFWIGTETGHVDVFILNVLSVSPSKLTFGLIGQKQTVTVTEPGTKKWTATSSNTAVATVTPGSAKNKFVVTAVGSGSCSVTFKDKVGNSIPVPVSVP